MVAYVASATATNTTGTDATSVTVNKPSGTLEGHYMIAVTHGYVGDTFTPPSGWNFIDLYDDIGGSSLRSRVYAKFAGASEPSNYTFQFQPGPGGGAIGASIATFSDTVGLDTYLFSTPGFDTEDLSIRTSRDSMTYSVTTWRDTTSDTCTWTGATEAFDIVAKDAGTIYRGQSGAYSNQVDGGTVVTHTSNMTNSIDYGVRWIFAIGAAAPANESWSDGIAVEFDIAGTWTDVSSDVQYDGGIEISAGTSSKGSDVEPGRAAFTLDNRTGNYSPTYPMGSYYGNIGVGTACRISKTNGDVAYQTPGFDNYDASQSEAISRVRCTIGEDASNVLVDTDIRIDCEPETWAQEQTLAAKWLGLPFTAPEGATDCSWVFQLNSDRTLSFIWNSGSIGNFFDMEIATSTETVPNAIRQTLRVTIDVNNGASGNTVTFYYKEDGGSSWNQIGDAVVQSGTTSIQYSTVPVTVGATEPRVSIYNETFDLTRYNEDPNTPLFVFNDGAWGPNARPFIGKIYSFVQLIGIDGDEVMSPDFTTATNGSYSITDAQGNVWTIDGPGVFTNRHYRHHGTVTNWPQPRDTTGAYSWVDIESTGALQREQQGEQPEISALYQYYTNPRGINEISSSDFGVGRSIPRYPIGYWPIEDGENSEEISSALSGGSPGTIYGTVETGSGDFYVGSKPIAKILPDGHLGFHVNGAVAGAYVAEFLLYTPSGHTHNKDMVNLYTSGTDYRFKLTYTNTNEVSATIYNKAGTVLDSATGVTMDISTKRAKIFIAGHDGFVSVYYQIQGSYDITNTGIFLDNGAGTTGRITAVSLTPEQTDGVYVGHLAIFDGADADPYPYGSYLGVTGAPYDDALIGLSGEQPARRARRLINYRELLPYVIGDNKVIDSRNGQLMGRQYPSTFIDGLREVQATDGGFVYEPRNFAGLGYRTLRSMYNTAPVLELDYAGNQLSGAFSPTFNDQNVINDATVTKIKGGSARYTKTSGANNVNRPPDGVGRYSTDDSLSLYATVQAEQQAAWRVFLGTNDELKIDSITVSTENANYNTGTDAVNRLLIADIGDSITIDNLPDKLTPDQMVQTIIGYTERFDQFTHDITFRTVSGTAYNPGRTRVSTSTTSTKANTEHSTLYSSATSSDTSLNVTTTDGYARWVTSADSVFNSFDINVGGERMTVSAVGVADSFTRSASNGWGTASSGNAWTNAGGTASEYSVNGTVGQLSLASVNISRIVFTAAPSADVDVQAAFATPALATGGSQFGGVVARYIDGNNLYYARLAFNTTQTLTLVVQKRVAAVQTDISTLVIPGTHAANTFFNVRFSVVGSTLKAKAWQEGNPEPDWQITTTDSALTSAGSIGVRGVLNSTNTNTLPVTMSVDNFRLNRPQVFTVARSVNGISKAHSSDAQVKLFKPRHAGL